MDTPAPNPELPLSTIGHTHLPGFLIPLRHVPDETFAPRPGVETRFRLILVDGGSGILACDGRQTVFAAPALFSFNERETVALSQAQNLHAQAFYFHPSLIHPKLDFDSARDPGGQFGWYDHLWLRPFITRDAGWTGIARLGPAAFARMNGLFTALANELEAQRDGFWPCRSRSFFLEILFLLERLCASPDAAERELLAADDSLVEVEPVLLYLHNHYGEKLSLDLLAREFHTNRTTLTKQFHAKTGMPVMAYLGKLRIDLAALMLRDTSIPVGEIVARTGFASLTHFSRTFHKTTGFTPTKYREHFCWAK